MRIRRLRGAELELVLVEDVVDDGASPRRDLKAWGATVAARSTEAMAAVLRGRAGKERAARGRRESELGFVRGGRGGVAVDLKEPGGTRWPPHGHPQPWTRCVRPGRRG